MRLHQTDTQRREGVMTQQQPWRTGGPSAMSVFSASCLDATRRGRFRDQYAAVAAADDRRR